MLMPLVTMIMIFMGALAFYTADLVQIMDHSARLARLKAHVTNIETAARNILLSPSSYECNTTGGVSGCVFRGLSGTPGTVYNGSAAVGTPMHSLAKLVEPLDAVFCSSSQHLPVEAQQQEAPCKFKISKTPQIRMDPGEPHPVVSMELKFEGKFALAPVVIIVKPSPEALQASSAQCDGIFEGFNRDGTIRCRANGFVRAPAGQYISGLNLRTYEATFSWLPAIVRDCAGPNQFLSGYQWKGGENYEATCGGRVSPFATF